MIRKKFSFLAKFDLPREKVKYQFIRTVTDYQEGEKIILVEQLDPDYFLLFSKVKLIITTQGSVLSHLAILAREFSIPIIKIKADERIKNKGQIKIDKKEIIFYE